MTVLIGILATAAVVIWLLAVVTFVRLAGRLSGRKSLGAMLVQGIAWFDSRNFRPDAAGLLRTMRFAFAGFFGCILALAIATALGAGRT